MARYTGGMIIEVMWQEDLDLKVSEHDVVAVVLGSPWCGPCTRLLPALGRLSEREQGVVWLYVNVDATPEIAARLGITSVPTVVVWLRGELAGVVVAPRSAQQVSRELSRITGDG